MDVRDHTPHFAPKPLYPAVGETSYHQDSSRKSRVCVFQGRGASRLDFQGSIWPTGIESP